MDTIRNILRWVIAFGLVAVGLLYLNSAIYSLWAAGGPPTEIPNAWLHRALVHFGFFVALISTAVVAFKVLKKGFSLQGNKVGFIWLAIIAVSIVYPSAKEFLLVDSCLDSGGRWSERHFECQR